MSSQDNQQQQVQSPAPKIDIKALSKPVTPPPTTTPAIVPTTTPTPLVIEEEAIDLSETDARYAAYSARIARVVNTLKRFTAYTSDVGESFRPVVHPHFVTACYGISWAYTLLDSGNEAKKAYAETQGDKEETVRAGSQRLVFNALASMILPMFTIHFVVHQSQHQFAKTSLSPAVKRWTPVALGLAVVPFLPVMFDQPVEMACEYVWDKAWPSKFPQRHHHHGHPAPHGDIAHVVPVVDNKAL